jgi:hypothetical protein
MKTHWNKPAAPMGKEGKTKKANVGGKKLTMSKFNGLSNGKKATKAGPDRGF